MPAFRTMLKPLVTLLLFSTALASAAPVAAEDVTDLSTGNLVDSLSAEHLTTEQALDVTSILKRQGSCLATLRRPNPTNNLGLRSIQNILVNRQQATLIMNNLVDVHVNAETFTTTHAATFTIVNRESRANTILLNYYAEGRVTGTPQRQIRIDVPASRRSGGINMSGTVTQCAALGVGNGAWYVQVER